MTHSVIVLTNGISGSSVLTGLLARSGYWTGAATFAKTDYDTHENVELIELNKKIMQQLGYHLPYTQAFSPELVMEVARRHAELDKGQLASFVRDCDAHSPWVWKDPRLWVTIRVWSHVLDFDRLKIIVLSRNYRQVWISGTLRRWIESPHCSRLYNEGIRRSILSFLDENRLSFLDLWYDDLIVHPEPTLSRLNGFLGTDLVLADLQAVYRGPLYRQSRGFRDWLVAWAIFLKNFRQRKCSGRGPFE